MKITVLMENIAKEGFLCEHGLSLYIETSAGQKILFDTGASDAFVENAQKLGVDLAEVDFAFISHGHRDHSGGIRKFLEINKKAPVYVAVDAFERYYNAELKEISIDAGITVSGRIILVRNKLDIASKIHIADMNNAERKHYAGTYGLMRLVKGKLVPDSFEHEMYLTMEENGKKIVFSGCSHKGILNIVDWFKPNVVIGGFHFFKLDVNKKSDAEYLQQATDFLKASGAVFYTCHCTGEKQFAFMREYMPELEYVSAGSVLEI